MTEGSEEGLALPVDSRLRRFSGGSRLRGRERIEDLSGRESIRLLPGPPAVDVPRVQRGARQQTAWYLRGIRGHRLVLILFSDVFTLVMATYLTVWGPLRYSHWSGGRGPLAVFPAAALILLASRGTYRHRLQDGLLDELARVAGVVSLAAIFTVGIVSLIGTTPVPATVVLRTWILATGLVCSARVAIAALHGALRARGLVGMPTLIVGAEGIGAQIARRIEASPRVGLRVIGFVDSDPLLRGESEDEVPLLGPPDEISQIAEQTGAQHVILAGAPLPQSEMDALARRCFALALEVSVVPRMLEHVNRRMALDSVGGIPLLRLRPSNPRSAMFRFKHIVDRGAAAALILLLSPLLLVCAVAVRLSSPGPVMFRQRRTGRDGRHFDVLKFRTMVAKQGDQQGFVLAHDSAPGGVEGEDRRTRVGRFLRRTSLDELPQLVNVLRGEMSLVGPRPERPEFAAGFQQDHTRYSDRLRVKAGITGLAQIHGLRGQTPLSARIDYDNYYIDNWSFWLDVKILLATLPALFRGE